MTNEMILLENIATKIAELRGMKVMIDSDLAQLYKVPVKVLNQTVKRNIKRFPSDFMFQLTRDESIRLRSQSVTLKRGYHRKYLPFAFTREGIAMLSGILNSDTAIQANIRIMRAFVQYHEFLPNYKNIVKEFHALKDMVNIHDDKLKAHFVSISYLLKNLPTKSAK